jgi:hypothetical protein
MYKNMEQKMEGENGKRNRHVSYPYVFAAGV